MRISEKSHLGHIAAPRFGRTLMLGFLCGLVAICLAIRSGNSVFAQGNAEPAAAATAEPGGVPMVPSHSMVQIMRNGGVMMWPIVCCSFVLLAFVFERLIALRRGRVIPGPFVK